jgi:hypothetical protein
MDDGATTLYDVALAVVVRNPRESGLRVETLAAVPPTVAVSIFDALFVAGKLTPKLVETFLALEQSDLTSRIRERNIRLVGGRTPWTPPLNVHDDGYKKRQY